MDNTIIIRLMCLLGCFTRISMDYLSESSVITSQFLHLGAQNLILLANTSQIVDIAVITSSDGTCLKLDILKLTSSQYDTYTEYRFFLDIPKQQKLTSMEVIFYMTLNNDILIYQRYIQLKIPNIHLLTDSITYKHKDIVNIFIYTCGDDSRPIPSSLEIAIANPTGEKIHNYSIATDELGLYTIKFNLSDITNGMLDGDWLVTAKHKYTEIGQVVAPFKVNSQELEKQLLVNISSAGYDRNLRSMLVDIEIRRPLVNTFEGRVKLKYCIESDESRCQHSKLDTKGKVSFLVDIEPADLMSTSHLRVHATVIEHKSGLMELHEVSLDVSPKKITVDLSNLPKYYIPGHNLDIPMFISDSEGDVLAGSCLLVAIITEDNRIVYNRKAYSTSLGDALISYQVPSDVTGDLVLQVRDCKYSELIIYRELPQSDKVANVEIRGLKFAYYVGENIYIQIPNSFSSYYILITRCDGTVSQYISVHDETTTIPVTEEMLPRVYLYLISKFDHEITLQYTLTVHDADPLQILDDDKSEWEPLSSGESGESMLISIPNYRPFNSDEDSRALMLISDSLTNPKTQSLRQKLKKIQNLGANYTPFAGKTLCHRFSFSETCNQLFSTRRQHDDSFYSGKKNLLTVKPIYSKMPASVVGIKPSSKRLQSVTDLTSQLNDNMESQQENYGLSTASDEDPLITSSFQGLIVNTAIPATLPDIQAFQTTLKFSDDSFDSTVFLSATESPGKRPQQNKNSKNNLPTSFQRTTAISRTDGALVTKRKHRKKSSQKVKRVPHYQRLDNSMRTKRKLSKATNDSQELIPELLSAMTPDKRTKRSDGSCFNTNDNIEMGLNTRYIKNVRSCSESLPIRFRITEYETDEQIIYGVFIRKLSGLKLIQPYRIRISRNAYLSLKAPPGDLAEGEQFQLHINVIHSVKYLTFAHVRLILSEEEAFCFKDLMLNAHPHMNFTLEDVSSVNVVTFIATALRGGNYNIKAELWLNDSKIYEKQISIKVGSISLEEEHFKEMNTQTQAANLQLRMRYEKNTNQHRCKGFRLKVDHSPVIDDSADYDYDALFDKRKKRAISRHKITQIPKHSLRICYRILQKSPTGSYYIDVESFTGYRPIDHPLQSEGESCQQKINQMTYDRGQIITIEKTNANHTWCCFAVLLEATVGTPGGNFPSKFNQSAAVTMRDNSAEYCLEFYNIKGHNPYSDHICSQHGCLCTEGTISACKHLRAHSTRRASVSIAQMYLTALYTFKVRVTHQDYHDYSGYYIDEAVIEESYGNTYLETGKVVHLYYKVGKRSCKIFSENEPFLIMGRQSFIDHGSVVSIYLDHFVSIVSLDELRRREDADLIQCFVNKLMCPARRLSSSNNTLPRHQNDIEDLSKLVTQICRRTMSLDQTIINPYESSDKHCSKVDFTSLYEEKDFLDSINRPSKNNYKQRQRLRRR